MATQSSRCLLRFVRGPTKCTKRSSLIKCQCQKSSPTSATSEAPADPTQNGAGTPAQPSCENGAGMLAAPQPLGDRILAEIFNAQSVKAMGVEFMAQVRGAQVKCVQAVPCILHDVARTLHV